jgi:hypothetical protein
MPEKKMREIKPGRTRSLWMLYIQPKHYLQVGYWNPGMSLMQ